MINKPTVEISDFLKEEMHFLLIYLENHNANFFTYIVYSKIYFRIFSQFSALFLLLISAFQHNIINLNIV